MDRKPFERKDSRPVDLPEPFGSTLAFLSDLHEQIELQEAQTDNPGLRTVLDKLKKSIAGAGLIVMLMGGG